MIVAIRRLLPGVLQLAVLVHFLNPFQVQALVDEVLVEVRVGLQRHPALLDVPGQLVQRLVAVDLDLLHVQLALIGLGLLLDHLEDLDLLAGHEHGGEQVRIALLHPHDQVDVRLAVEHLDDAAELPGQLPYPRLEVPEWHLLAVHHHQNPGVVQASDDDPAG